MRVFIPLYIYTFLSLYFHYFLIYSGVTLWLPGLHAENLHTASIVILAIILIVGLPAFLLLYKAPTCFDGKQNQGEGGIDCGGPCVKLCPSAFLPPEVIWT